MALQLPEYLKTKSPQHLYSLMRATYERNSRAEGAEREPVCTDRPYGMEICLGPDRDGIRYGSFKKCKLDVMDGFFCTSGHFFSKTVQFKNVAHELRAGAYTEGDLQGQHGVTIVDAKDTQYMAAVVGDWDEPHSNTPLLSASLNQACIPAQEHFERKLELPPDAALSSLSPTEVASDMIISGTRTYCASPADMTRVSDAMARGLRNLNAWWTQFQGYLAVATHALSMLAPNDQAQGQKNNPAPNNSGWDQLLAQNQDR